MRFLPLIMVAAVAGCVPTNPFDRTTRASVSTLDGTITPKPEEGIQRYEPFTADGNGYAKDFVYNAATNTYTVDNLAFDGANTYRLNAANTATLSYSVYEPTSTELDPTTGLAIDQFTHRLIGATSRTGRTTFGIVRTGAYTGFGFGGFLLRRNDGVILPLSGQARYDGNYAGLRDRSGMTGLHMTTGRMTIAIDFEDFNSGDAVKGSITGRRFFNLDGTEYTASYIDDINSKYALNGTPEEMTALPTLVFDVGPGVIDKNGEIEGGLGNQVWDRRGDLTLTTFETGKYYAIVSGPNADEVVGVIVVSAENPRVASVIDRETGGFILYRPE